MAVKEWNEQIIFLRRSWKALPTELGIKWQKLAGIPHSVIDRAGDLDTMESKERDGVEETRPPRSGTSTRQLGSQNRTSSR